MSVIVISLSDPSDISPSSDSLRQLLYLIPAFPVLTTAMIALRFSRLMKKALTPERWNPARSRTVSLSMAGFSFTGVVGIAVLQESIQKTLELPMYYLVLSFLCYLCAANLESYKFFVSRQMISHALTESASLSLTCAVVSVVFLGGYGQPFTLILLAIAVVGWLGNHALVAFYVFRVFTKEEKQNDTTQGPADEGR
ncbi:MAG TPA: hypothetical protein PLZ79_04210 [Burkholderiales bacterium]|nr:hypothetical protein [Burkholderiales bacterium]